MNELLPCPFCGGESVMQVSKRWPDGAEQAVDGYTAVCQSLDCILGGDDEWWCDTEAEAIAAWNTRADDYRHAAEYWQRMYENTFAERTCQLIEDSGLLHCSECGGAAEKQSWAYWHYCPNCGARVRSE